MTRIILAVLGLFVGGALGFMIAAGAFEVLNPVPDRPEATTLDDAQRRTAESMARSQSRMNWILPGMLLFALGGAAGGFFLAPAESDSTRPRPPADLKVGPPSAK